MLRDPRFGSKVLDKHEYAAMLESHGEVINKYGELWDCHIESQEDLEERVEELIWAATLMYGVGSWDGNEVEYRADFFTYVQPTDVFKKSDHCTQCAYRDISLVYSLSLRVLVASITNEVASGTLFDEHHLVACSWSSRLRSQIVHLSTTSTASQCTTVQVLQHPPRHPANPIWLCTAFSNVALFGQPKPMVSYPC